MKQPFVIRSALVVNPDENLHDLLTRTLDPGEWTIRYVSTNAAAIQAVRDRGYELIITSQKTSGRQDVELLQKLRRHRPHTRVIILANESTPQDVIDAMRDNAFSLFSSPYSLDRLRDMVQLAIETPCWDDGIELVCATPEWLRLAVRCQVPAADRLLQFIKEISDLPQAEREQVGLALRELLLNAIEHGGRLDPDNYVDVEYVRARGMISCRISDPGSGFTLDEIPHSAVANPQEDPLRHVEVRNQLGLRPGGFGILLARHLVDQVLYGERGNEVLLIKYLDHDAAVTKAG